MISALNKGALTDFLDGLVHLCVVHEGKNGAFKWGNRRWEVEESSVWIILAFFEAVLEYTVKDSTDTEGWLNHVRDVLFFMRHCGILLECDVLFAQFEIFTTSFDCNAAILLHLSCELCQIFFALLVEEWLEKLVVFFELFAIFFFVKDCQQFRLFDWFIKPSSCHQITFCFFRVAFKIEC